MKLLRGFLFLFILLAAQGLRAQNCTGDFTWFLNGNTVTFIGSTTPNIAHITWDFGDGNFDFTNSTSPSHNYATNGNYTVCMICSDSLYTCSDTTCHVVNYDTCYASFYFTQSGNTIYFNGYANGGSANTVYQWNFGNNNTSTQQNPSFTFPGPGSYNVCFAYYDLTTGCSDSICSMVPVNSCNADFTSVDSMGYAFFINTSTPGNSGTYYWDFGDGNYSTQQNPSNVYSATGTYLVCLTAYDSLQNFCDSTCHYITITNVVGVNEKKIGISEVLLSPNPSDGNCDLTFTLAQAAPIRIEVYDVFGKKINEIKNENAGPGKQIVPINTNVYSSGVYFVKVNVNGQITTTKMIVTHKQ